MKTCLEDGRITGPDADDNGTDICGYSLLRQAVYNESVEVTKPLLDYGYSVRKSSPEGLLLIHEASNCGQEIIELLLESGASHLDRNSEGDNIWHLAAQHFQCDTLLALLQLAGDKKMEALQSTNGEGFTPLALAIQVSIEQQKHREQGATAVIELLLNACKGDASCWQCAGSPWELAARSGSAAVVGCLAESGVSINPIQKGQPSPLHVLSEQASKECVELLKTSFPTAKALCYNGQLPLETLIYRCVANGMEPQEGVTASLANKGLLVSESHEKYTLWEYFCRDIIRDTIFKGRKLQLAQGRVAEFMVRELLKTDALEIYEQVQGSSAVVLLFARLRRSQIFHALVSTTLQDVLSRTKSWSTFCHDKETIEYGKFLIRCTAAVNSTSSMAKTIHVLLSSGVNMHQQSNSFSILGEACTRLGCDDTNVADEGLTSTSHFTLERQVFLDVLSHTNREQLNSVRFTTDGYLQLLARKPYHSGSLWMVKQLVKSGIDPNGSFQAPSSHSPLVSCLLYSATPLTILLLELGAVPALRHGPYDVDASLAAALRGRLEFLESLLNKLQENTMLYPVGANSQCGSNH
jgi:ankyrin repeat protein